MDENCRQLRDRIINCADQEKKCELYKQYRCLKKCKKRSYKKNVIDTIDTACGVNTKLFWSTVNSLPYNVRQRQKSCKMDASAICQHLQEISEIPEQVYFNKHFETECELFLI